MLLLSASNPPHDLADHPRDQPFASSLSILAPNINQPKQYSWYLPVKMSSLPRRLEDKVVLDIGSLYIKCGYSGESRPRAIVPAHLSPYANTLDGSRAIEDLLPLWNLEIGYEEVPYIEARIADLLHRIYERNLLVDPRSRKVVVCEGPLLSMPVKRAITTALFDVLRAPSITWLPSGWTALVSCGRQTGLVIDVGYNETTIQAVYDGRPLVHTIRSIPKAGSALTKRLASLLTQDSEIVVDDTLLQDMNVFGLTIWEDMKARTLKVPFQSSVLSTLEGSIDSSTHFIPYTFESTQVMMPEWICERAAEVLFEEDEDEVSLRSSVAECLLKCSSDIRSEVVRNVLVIGGTSSLSGFRQRLYNEVGILKPNFPPNTVSWVGASLVSSLKLPFTEFSQDDFRNGGASMSMIPDWSWIQEAA
ncbi:hypothetical protein SeMB42_g05056 [Synchytrium endobioticum]|uniref:Actin n=1 Tax=Synchytrium endobioticum TaxID=286115 RepID=A0A507CU40_9FUNG|nr:hypothetical protein SeMB42_g05056 [Synchytrium endobioticum]